MKIVLDTNIVLDTLANREPFFEMSHAVMQLVADGTVQGCITANSITDIHYILRKHLDKETLMTALRNLLDLFEIVALTRAECIGALELSMKDYEDALLSCCAKSCNAECIVTRNTKDFVESPVKAMTPEAFLKLVDTL